MLRGALAEYLAALPRTRRTAFLDFDLQPLLSVFIERFGELPLPRRVRTLAFAAKDARNEVAHYAGSLTPDLALHHLSTLRHLLEALGAERAFDEVERLYHEQLHGLRPQEQAPDASVASGSLGPASSQAERSDDPPSTSGISFEPTGAADRPSAPRGKYLALFRHLNAVPGDVWHTTFTELETILGFPVAAVCTHPPGLVEQFEVTQPIFGVARRWLDDPRCWSRSWSGVFRTIPARSETATFLYWCFNHVGSWDVQPASNATRGR